MTTLLGMVSPSQEFCHETNNTLSFALKCSKIQNVVKPNRYRNLIPASVAVKKKVALKASLPWNPKEKVPYEELKIKTKQGIINVAHAGDKSWPDKCILLHGCPSSIECMLHHLPAYMHMKYQVFAIDLPGYGESTGECQPSRSELVLAKGGPAETIKAIMKELDI